jgi:hypothetical protein
MTPYGISKRDSRTCAYGCCHGGRAASKHINVRYSTDHARNPKFKPAVRAYGRSRARAGERADIRAQLTDKE